MTWRFLLGSSELTIFLIIWIAADLEKSLSYLGLSNRQSLIMVRHLGVTRDFRGASSSADQRNSAANGGSSDENGDGYFAFVRRILSYVNPFSYLGGTRHETQGDVRQYSEFLFLK